MSRAIAWHRRLHVRITAAVALLMVVLAATLLGAARHHAARDALEAAQRLQLGLAAAIVAQQPRPLIDAAGQPDRALLADLAMHAMAVNPAIEVYLLDTAGRVIGHALDAPGALDARVDLAVVRPLAARTIAPPPLPLLGDDPRRPGTRTVVSVEGLSVDGRMAGYLYVVLQGQTLQALQAAVAQSGAWQDLALLAALATAGAAAMLVWVMRTLTGPLRRLTDEVGQFRAEGGDAAEDPQWPPGGEVEALRAATVAMQRRIGQQLAHLHEGDRLRRELVSNISHDLHTPLASVRGYVETLLLAGDRLDADARGRHLRTVMRHLGSLQRRIGDLFELSRLDADQVRLQPEVFRLTELLQDVVQGGQWVAQERGVSLTLADRGAGPARVRADIGLIERVLQNLIDNALRHTPRGGAVTLAVEPDGADRLRIAVIDTGSGIAREHLPHVFERYWRADDTRQPPGHGASAGLGLAIVKRILDLHGCVVQVYSAPSQGTRFEFSLPQVALPPVQSLDRLVTSA